MRCMKRLPEEKEDTRFINIRRIMFENLTLLPELIEICLNYIRYPASPCQTDQNTLTISVRCYQEDCLLDNGYNICAIKCSCDEKCQGCNCRLICRENEQEYERHGCMCENCGYFLKLLCTTCETRIDNECVKKSLEIINL